MDKLSQRDSIILNSIFNPHLPLDAASADKQDLKDEEELTPETIDARTLEIEAIILAEKGEFPKALDILNKAINIAPNKASLYNNRGHVLQFLRKFDEALDDITKAVELSKDTKLQKTYCQALIQRGILYRRQGDTENARKDFEIAAKMGDVFAKNQVVELNPYAALCNQMLKQVRETWS